ncbi:MAG: class I SAM-dependent methyltransferase, partial [Desulfobulbaceae bacterium]|nr:class I SAM-dependent methyltransferase [Desulfobulbaceae bacterium]
RTMQFRDLDWNQMWQEARKGKSWRGRKKDDWDKRAPSFAKRNMQSLYATRFLDLLRPDPTWTALDFGAGPGTLALPLAKMVSEVTATDFSTAMLDILNQEAATLGVNNIHTVQAAWEDDWLQLGIKPHDLVIASRSLSVDNLQAALTRMNDWATKRVVISDRVGTGPFDPDLFAAAGRALEPGPDYIYTVNILYQMGIQAEINYINLDQQRIYTNRDEAIDACRWMLGKTSPDEETALARYVDDRLEPLPDGMFALSRRTPIRWAVISWNK